MLKSFILVGAGGAIGGILRYGCALAIGPRPHVLATLLINIAGSFLIGMVMAYSFKNISFADNWRLFLATGVCGGFTTFSAFSFENLQYVLNGKYIALAMYAAGSVVSGLIAVWLGFKLTNILTR